MIERRRLSGWGNVSSCVCRVEAPTSSTEVSDLLGTTGSPSIIARGQGQSYGDAALNPNGVTMLTERLPGAMHLDAASGILRCAANVTLGQVIRHAIPSGWFLPVTPGSHDVTVGGAIASDVHGWNQRRAGSFSRHVVAFRILLGDGSTLECSPEREPELFAATAGGMGLTGVILEVEMRLARLETTSMRSVTVAASGLRAVMDAFTTVSDVWEYSFARLHIRSRRPMRVEGVVTFGRHLRRDELAPARAFQPLALAFPNPRYLPFDVPRALVVPVLRTFSALRRLRYYGIRGERTVSLVDYFFPTDRVRGLTRLYGKAGFAQYQCVIPESTAEAALGAMLERASADANVVAAAVLNRFGPGRGGLSFPIAGFMLALELPQSPAVAPLFAALDALVVGAGGRVYLAKDANLTPEAFRAMYPEHPAWLAQKLRYDPMRRFVSDLGRRLRMDEP